MPRTKREAVKLKQSQPASSLSTAELTYIRSHREVDRVCAKEDERRLHVRVQLLEEEKDGLNRNISTETERADVAEANIEDLQIRLKETETDRDTTRADLQARTQECDTLRTELMASKASSTDASNLLSEKLALTREVASMKPELEHLRSEVSNNSSLLSEKLALQRQLKDVQAEFEDNQRYAMQLEKHDEKRNGRTEELLKQIEDLKYELHEARSAMSKSETERDTAVASKIATTEASKIATTEASNNEELKSLQAQLSSELEERQKLEKQRAKESQGWEAEKAVLEDKLTQFRTKLRSTKEKLKDAEAELHSAQAAPVRAAPSAKGPANSKKTSRKRSAAEMAGPDTNMGTPGDGDANKRQKRASSVVGEKSNFSITPFLNRTTSVQPEGADEPMDSIEDCSPSMRTAPTTNTTQVILGPASAGKSNPRNKPKLSFAAEPTLEKVLEEDDSNDENAVPANLTATAAVKQKPSDNKPPKPALKPRKSLANFATFREGSLQPDIRRGSVPPVQAKKRRLLGSAGARTLFDEDEDGDDVGTGKSIFGGGGGGGGGQRTFGSLGRVVGTIGGGLVNKRKGPLQTADGFAFSPLKKERRAMAAASRAASEAPEA